MRRAIRSGLQVFLLALALLPSRTVAAAERTLAPRIVNGLYTSQYPTTGVLLDSNNPNTASMICSGTLIGCQTFLTAGHCVAASLNPADYLVFLQHAGFFSVASVALNPNFNFPVGDVAVLKLVTPVNGIAPTPIDTTSAPPFGASGTIVGFGRSGGGSLNTDYGLKRAGDVLTASCSGVSNTTSLCWDFTDPLGPPGTDSNTCNGDSGGPLFVDLGAGIRVAGVTSGGTSSTCLPTDNSFDANVFFYSSYIAAQAGTDLNNTSCGTLPQVGSPGTSILGVVGSLNSVATQGLHSVQVGPGNPQLRVAMNAIDDGSDFDLYVRFGSPPTTSQFDCKADGSNQYGFCQFTNPSPGTWYILVNRFAGSGSYQITATTFGVDCSNPLSQGQPCDDGNSCTSGDVCQSGTCAGTPVANGVSCDDGNPCTQPDTCQAGACTGSQSPRNDCTQPFVAQRGLLRLQERPGKPQRLNWNWTHGSLTTKAQFGAPTLSTSYDLCIYDQTAGVDQVIYRTHLAAGAACNGNPCWTQNRRGYRYRDSRTTNGGITAVSLKEGADGKARITLVGKGDALSLPGLPVSQPSTVTVQLSNGSSCWEARFSTNSDNSTTEFKARPD
jgi:trypsin/pre-peptidase